MAVTIEERPTNSPYTRKFNITIDHHTINTTLTRESTVVRNWIKKTLGRHRTHLNSNTLVVGLGVQWTHFTFTGASTLELCIGTSCLIYHLRHIDHNIPTILDYFLRDPRITFVDLWSELDAAKIIYSGHNLCLLRGMPLDLRCNCLDDDRRPLRVPEIANKVLGIDIQWDVDHFINADLDDWDVEQLSLQQVMHATVKAFVSFQVGLHDRAWEFNFHPAYSILGFILDLYL